MTSTTNTMNIIIEELSGSASASVSSTQQVMVTDSGSIMVQRDDSRDYHLVSTTTIGNHNHKHHNNISSNIAQHQPLCISGASSSSLSSTSSTLPYAYIVEQPAKCGVRFRYECEGRISSAIPGATSNATRYTFPTIAIANHAGPVKVIVSCVTKNAPYRPHPHNLVGKKFCYQGICVATFREPICQFNNLGILCAKRKDVKNRLRLREQQQIDPFGTGFDHYHQHHYHHHHGQRHNNPHHHHLQQQQQQQQQNNNNNNDNYINKFSTYDLNVVRLCFQAFLQDSITGKFTVPLEPIVSDEIYDKKAMSDLSIVKLSHYSSPITGGKSVILLCDRVIKDDIQIRFFRYAPGGGGLRWERFAKFDPGDIHKHFAITFRVPAYDINDDDDDDDDEDDGNEADDNDDSDHHDISDDISEHERMTRIRRIPVNVQLRRPSDGGHSDPVTFFYTKRAKHSNGHHHHHRHNQNGDERGIRSCDLIKPPNQQQQYDEATNVNHNQTNTNSIQLSHGHDRNEDELHDHLNGPAAAEWHGEMEISNSRFESNHPQHHHHQHQHLQQQQQQQQQQQRYHHVPIIKSEYESESSSSCAQIRFDAELLANYKNIVEQTIAPPQPSLIVRTILPHPHQQHPQQHHVISTTAAAAAEDTDPMLLDISQNIIIRSMMMESSNTI